MGVFQGNMGTAPNQSVFTADIGSITRLATSAPFARYLTEEIFQRSAFVRSGIMQLDSRLNNITGVRVELPFFAPLDYVEEQVQSSNDWGTNGAGFYTTQQTTAASQFATITTRGAAFAADDLSQVQTGEDALANIRSQLATDMNRKMTAKLLSQLTGLVGPGGPLAATNALDVSVTANPGDVNFLSANTVTQAKYLLGERAASVTTIAVHPTVAAALEVTGMLTFSANAAGAGETLVLGGGGIGISNTQIGQFAGLRVVVDEQLPVRGAAGDAQQFVCYLFGSGVVRTGSQFPLLIETERNILSLQDTFAVTYNNCMHILGTSWNANFDNPTNAQLADDANWALAYEEPRLIPLVELTVNSPFGGVVV